MSAEHPQPTLKEDLRTSCAYSTLPGLLVGVTAGTLVELKLGHRSEIQANNDAVDKLTVQNEGLQALKQSDQILGKVEADQAASNQQRLNSKKITAIKSNQPEGISPIESIGIEGSGVALGVLAVTTAVTISRRAARYLRKRSPRTSASTVR